VEVLCDEGVAIHIGAEPLVPGVGWSAAGRRGAVAADARSGEV
jgi:hypothetical protein